MTFRIVSILILIFTFTNVFRSNSVLADTGTNKSSFVDTINCYNTNPKALNNSNPVIGTKTDCELSTDKSNTELDKFRTSPLYINQKI